MPSIRDVSPLGTSRFEQPYSPPRNWKASANTSPVATWTTPFTPFRFGEWRDSSSTIQTGTTQGTSLEAADDASPNISCASTVCSMRDHEMPDEWLAKFPTESNSTDDASDEVPDRATLAAIHHIPIYSANGEPRLFGSLIDPASATHQRQLLVFIRHFYCGACQAYVRALAEGITTQEYFSVPTPTSITVIGCGKPNLIPLYKKITGCPFQIYAEPTRDLFKKLGMGISFNPGSERPEYMSDISPVQWAMGQGATIHASLKSKDIKKRDVIKGGNPMQIGGEFLMEDGKVLWCHRMRNYRNHAEVPRIRQLLELDV